MSRQALMEYIIALCDLYQGTKRRKEKTQLLDHAIKITGKSRRSIQRYLASPPTDEALRVKIRIEGRGRQPYYRAEELLPH